MPKKAIVLLSGGMDSAAALYWAKNKGYRCHCLIFDYGQRHKKEIHFARALARAAKAACAVIPIKLPWTGGSSLLDSTLKLPAHSMTKIGKNGIPSTYVPGRNTLFLAYAISAADALDAEAVVLGPNALDYSGYPDCRPEYYRAMRRAAQLGTKRGNNGQTIQILTPLIGLSKAQIARLGADLRVPWERTWSCYAGGRRPCRRCDSCKLRAKGFREAGLIDPLIDVNVK
ncbi:MAG: 7-cyano-7-deazaguanine synthase QueC [Elusimicrobia bacterium]|nr:7-cyano-7-deazaguanine synthase QueC [Elusimicrobiota bacterium]